MQNKIFVFLVFFYSLNSFSQIKKVCHIVGTVSSPDIKSILLKNVEQDLRFDSILQIPVKNNRFDYKLPLKHDTFVEVMVGSAIKEGGGAYMPLFLSPGQIEITINKEEDFSKNNISGGFNNAKYAAYNQDLAKRFMPRFQSIYDSINLLRENKLYFSSQMQDLKDKLVNVTTPEEKTVILDKIELLKKQKLDKSGLGKKFDQQIEDLYQERNEYQQQFIEKDCSLVSYYLFLSDLVYNKQTVDLELARKNLATLSHANPGHPYNKVTASLIESIQSIKIGAPFVDFSAPNLKGEEVLFSSAISGKIVLLDLWATWCAPCIRHSRSVLPVYEEYKDKGFTVIGVAGEFKNTKRLTEFLEKEKWPWINLVELDRQNQIWQKYGVDNGGGGIFLIGRDGKIIAINPTAEEVRKELEKQLK